ncbi:MAG: PKD domain-containing protein, partial [Bacteroidota bacterium]
MFHKSKKIIALLSVLIVTAVIRLNAQPCADTQPVIAGSQVVSNSQTGVIYSTANIPGHSYLWIVNGGTITSGAGTNQVTVTWGAVGAGNISVQETNPLVPCSTTVNKFVSVQPLLISYFYYTNTSCYGDVVSFHDASVADAVFPIVSWEWTFGDGGTSNLQNPSHQYLPNLPPLAPYDTTYDIRLIVTNTIGYKDTIYDAVYVNPNQFIPTATFTSTIPNCLYDAVIFNSSASTTPLGTDSIIHHLWNFGDPASGSSNIVNTGGASFPTASHVFSAPGTYTVTLEITNARYCKGSTTRTIVITPSLPTALYTYSSPTCLGNPVNFNDQSLTPSGHNLTNWEWNYGDGSFLNLNQNSVHIFPGLGPYTVQLKVTNDLGCHDSIRKNVGLDPSPASNFTWDSKCFGDTIKFDNKTLLNNGPPIATYYWNFGDPGSSYNYSTQMNPRHVFSAAGTYNVLLVSTNTSGCPDSVIKQLVMFPPPTCNYTWAYGATNQEVHFHIDSSSTNYGAIGNMVLWDFGDGAWGYGWNPTHIYPAGGTFDVVLKVTDTIGCSGTMTHQIFVPAAPMAFFTSNAPVCFNKQPVCFTDLSHASTPPFGFIKTWVWNYGDGSPKDTIHFPFNPNHCHTFAIADTFAVQLQVFDNYGYSDSITINTIVLPDPKANFQWSSITCPDQQVFFTDGSYPNGGGNIISWNWDFGDPGSATNNFSTLQSPSHIFTNGGVTYLVKLAVQNFNGCTDTMKKQVYIHPKPPVQFSFDTACLNQLVHFYADTMVMYKDSIASWSWNFGDGTPLVIDPVN